MRLPLRLKWAFVTTVVAVTPILLLAVVTIRVQRSGLLRVEQELEVAVVDDASRQIERRFEDVAETTHRVVTVLADARLPDDARESQLKDIVGAPHGPARVTIYDASGKVIDALVPKSGGSRENGADVVDPKLKGWFVGDGSNGPRLPSFAEAIAPDGEVRGLAVGDPSLGGVTDALHALSEARFGSQGVVTLIDRAGVVLASSGSMKRGDVLAGKGALAAGLPPAEGLAVHREYDVAGTSMVGTMRTLPRFGLSIVVERKEAAAFETLADSRRSFVWASALVGILAAGIGALFASRVTKPVTALVELTRAYGQRAWDAKSVVRTGDELETLGDAMTDMATSLAGSEKEIARRAAVESGLSRYMPKEIAKAVADGEKVLALGGERKTISIVFADVAAFTPFAERATPEAVTSLLNELFSILSEVVFRNEGMVDKFMGDCIMAVFGSTGAPDHVERAVACAEDMLRFVRTSAPAWSEKFGFDVHLGIGVATGEALVGNLGSEARMEYTVVGDAVNVASRLEGLARPDQVLVTKAVVDAVPSNLFTFRTLGPHPIRGKAQPVEIFELEP